MGLRCSGMQLQSIRVCGRCLRAMLCGCLLPLLACLCSQHACFIIPFLRCIIINCSRQQTRGTFASLLAALTALMLFTGIGACGAQAVTGLFLNPEKLAAARRAPANAAAELPCSAVC